MGPDGGLKALSAKAWPCHKGMNNKASTKRVRIAGLPKSFARNHDSHSGRVSSKSGPAAVRLGSSLQTALMISTFS